MAGLSIADASRAYLDYLDKEMTIQGILSAFCVAFSAAVFDRVLGPRPEAVSPLVKLLQTSSSPYVLAAIGGLALAALCFYLQRSGLAWVYGQISLAIAREHQEISPESSTFLDSLAIGDSWCLWNYYKFGMSFLMVTAVEVALALGLAISSKNALLPSLISVAPYLIAVGADVYIWRHNEKLDAASGMLPARQRLGGTHSRTRPR